MSAHGMPGCLALQLALAAALSTCACAAVSQPSPAARPEATDPPPAKAQASAPVSSTAGKPSEDARQVCEAMIRATRGCRDPYLTALLRTRVRFDQPPGIAARYAERGEEALLTLAKEEFAADWSDVGMTQRCDAFMELSKEQRQAVLLRERPCLSVKDDCEQFVACNVKALEAKWGQSVETPAEPTQ